MQIGESMVFNYTGTVQKVLLDDFRQLNADNIMPPLYKLECYGAQGGGGNNYGNYTCGYLQVDKPTELYLYVGGQGGVDINTYGWNSNSNGRREQYTRYAYQGTSSGVSVTTMGNCSGGATDIAFKGVEGSTSWNTSDHLNNILLRAKGGNGYSAGSSYSNYTYQKVWQDYGTRTSFSGTYNAYGYGEAVMRFYLSENDYDNYSFKSYYTKKEFENLDSSTRTKITNAANNHTKYNGYYWKIVSGAAHYGYDSKNPDIDYYGTLKSNTKHARIRTQNHTASWMVGTNDTDHTDCSSDGHVSFNSQETLYIDYENKRTSTDIKNGYYSDLYAKVYWQVTSATKLRAEVYGEVTWSYLVTTYYGGTCNYDNYFDTRLKKQASQSNVRAGNGMIRITRIAYTDLYKNSDIRFDSKIPNIMDYTDILNSFIQ